MKATMNLDLVTKLSRETIRLEGFDYGSDGAYFITICTHKKTRIFSEIINGEIKLSPLGKIVEDELGKTHQIRPYTTITDWAIMPDHLHLIMFIHKTSDEPEHLPPRGSDLYFPEGYKNKFGPQKENMASVIRGIKSAVTTRAKIAGIATHVWQRNFYEHIIRNKAELRRCVLYVKKNPLVWDHQHNYPGNL